MSVWLGFTCLTSDLVPCEEDTFFNCIYKTKSSTGCILLLSHLLFLTDCLSLGTLRILSRNFFSGWQTLIPT